MNLDTNYLRRISNMENPIFLDILDVRVKNQIYHDYYSLRISAQSLLKDPNNKETQRRLSELIRKLDIKLN